MTYSVMVTPLTLTQVFQVRVLIGQPFINCGYSMMLITSVFQTENPSWILGTRSKKIGFVLELVDITVLETVSERSESSSLSRPTIVYRDVGKWVSASFGAKKN